MDLNSKETTEQKLENAIGYIEGKAMRSQIEELTDIAWKFLIGMAIFDRVKALNIDLNDLEPINDLNHVGFRLGDALITVAAIKSDRDESRNQPNQ